MANIDGVERDVLSDKVNSHEAFKEIGKEGGAEALALVAAFMERNAREADAIQNSLIEGYQADAEKWKKRALKAEGQLHTAFTRFQDMLYAPYGDLPGENQH